MSHDVVDQKLAGLDAHVSQMYEWMPFMMSRSSGQEEPVPETQRERYEYLRKTWVNEPITEAVRQSLTKWYGPQADAAQQVESFELCEYGRIPDDEQLRTLFPFFETGS